MENIDIKLEEEKVRRLLGGLSFFGKVVVNDIERSTVIMSLNKGIVPVSIDVNCDNGYSAVVVRVFGSGAFSSYGAEDGLYEVQVWRDGDVVYDTPITNDVLGYLNERDVITAVSRIAEL